MSIYFDRYTAVLAEVRVAASGTGYGRGVINAEKLIQDVVW
jgi:hypothetical protein